ncbi:MAG: hypothetical protein J7527_07155 [Chitinophagaceae bacterium]|nr:hypothetical protein [Chitinophagaceae bacterium]
MAISHGLVPVTGRFGNVVYYYVGNEIYCRTICPNIRNRVMKEERYALFRLYSGLFGQSSKIASAIYRALGISEVKLYRTIVSEATKLFKHTPMKEEEVMEILWKKWVDGVDVESPEVERHGVTKKVIERNVGRTVREQIAKLQRKKAGKFRRLGGMVVGNVDAVNDEPIVIEKVEVDKLPVIKKRPRIIRPEVKIRWSRVLELEDELVV